MELVEEPRGLIEAPEGQLELAEEPHGLVEEPLGLIEAPEGQQELAEEPRGLVVVLLERHRDQKTCQKVWYMEYQKKSYVGFIPLIPF